MRKSAVGVVAGAGWDSCAEAAWDGGEGGLSAPREGGGAGIWPGRGLRFGRIKELGWIFVHAQLSLEEGGDPDGSVGEEKRRVFPRAWVF